MMENQVRKLNAILDGRPEARRPGEKNFRELAEDHSLDPAIREAMRFHAMSTKHSIDQDDQSQQLPVGSATDHTTLGEDEIVEDAGLFDHEQALETTSNQIALMTR